MRKATAVHSCWHAQPFPDIFVCVSVEAHLSASTIGGAVACWSCATSQPVGKAALFPGSFFFFRWTTVQRCLLGAGAPPWFPPPPSPSSPSPSKAHHAACTAATWAMVESWSPPRVARQKGERPDATVGGMSSGGRGGEAAPGVAVNAPCVRMGLCTSLPSPSGGARRGQPWRPPPARAAEAAYSHSSSGGRRGCRQRRGRSPRAPGGGGHAMPPLSTPPLPPFTCRGRRACATAAGHDAPATPLSFLSSRRRHRSHFALRVSPRHTTGCARYHSGGGEAPRSCSTVALSPAAPRPPTHQTLPPRSVSSCSPVSLPPLCCRGESSGVARGQFFPLLPLRRTAQDSRHVARVGGWTDGNRRRGG